MNLYIVTLVAPGRVWGKARASHIRALSEYQACYPHERVTWLYDAGNPPGVEEGHQIVTHKYQQARGDFLRGAWDVFVAIEDDMVLPEDALIRLRKLIEDGADVAYGLYVWRHGTFANKWSAYTVVGEERGVSLSDLPERDLWFGDVIPVAGVGMGCTAIWREALSMIAFERRGAACNDWYFALDAQERGLVQWCDTGLVCGHMTMEPTPRVLYPALNGENRRVVLV
jgi:hypothetical protein